MSAFQQLLALLESLPGHFTAASPSSQASKQAALAVNELHALLASADLSRFPAKAVPRTRLSVRCRPSGPVRGCSDLSAVAAAAAAAPVTAATCPSVVLAQAMADVATLLDRLLLGFQRLELTAGPAERTIELAIELKEAAVTAVEADYAVDGGLEE